MLILNTLFGVISGLALGLTGGGGSIIAVPLLLYGGHLSAHAAIQLSLYSVFITTFVGALYQIYRKNVALLSGIIMIAGGAIGSPVGALINKHLSPSVLIILFAVLMAIVGVRMLQRSFTKKTNTNSNSRPSNLFLFFAGMITGLLTGLLGVGGGFLIVPALLFATRLKMPQAIATSLFVISITAFISILAHGFVATEVTLSLVLTFTLGSLLGMFVGMYAVRHLSNHALQRLFAILVLIIGLFMLTKQFLF